MATKEHIAGAWSHFEFARGRGGTPSGWEYIGDGPHNGRLYVEHDLMTASSYSGSTVTRANIKAWKDRFADSQGDAWVLIHYSAGNGEAVALYEPALSAEQRAVLTELDEYPLIDDDLHYAEEAATVEECWENYGASEFEHELRRAGFEAADFLMALYTHALDGRANIDHHVEESDGSMYFRPEEAAQEVMAWLSRAIGYTPKET